MARGVGGAGLESGRLWGDVWSGEECRSAGVGGLQPAVVTQVLEQRLRFWLLTH